MQLFSDWSWKDWMLRSNWKGFSALAEVSISWDVFQRSGGLSFFFLWRTLMIMKIVVEVKVFILIYLNQSHSTAISICDNVHQTLTGRNFGEKTSILWETRPPSWIGGVPKANLRLHAFWFFFEFKICTTNKCISSDLQWLKPGSPDRHRHCKNSAENGIWIPWTFRKRPGFFQGFRVEKKVAFWHFWNEKVAHKNVRQESWHMFLVQQPWKIGWNHPNHSNRQKWSSSLQRKNALCFRISRFVGVSTYFFCCNLTTKQRAGPT